jgi:hypothetical protein
MGYKQNNNPFSRRTSSPLFSNHTNRTITTMLPSKNKVVTSIDNKNLNEQGETQQEVVNQAYNNIQSRINEMNNFYNTFDDLNSMSEEDITRFDEMEPEIRNNLDDSERNFIRVSDSINNVNKRFSPIKMNSPLNDNHDWEETLQDERGGYNVGEWGNETRVENPDGSITITQTRDLDRQSGGGEGFQHPDGLSWGEWLQTPAGKKWSSENSGQDTRTRTLRKREPVKPVSTITGENITDEREMEVPEIKQVVTPFSEDDMKRKRKEIELRQKEDERSKRKGKRKRFFNNIGYALGDAVDFVGDVGKFVVGNTGRSIVDVATAPIDAVRGVVGACRSCRKGIFDPGYLSIARRS